MSRSLRTAVILAACAVKLSSVPGEATAAAEPVLIKMGTAAPDGSSWHRILTEMGEQWKKSTNGAVELRIYSGGVLGDEPDMVRKMRVGQIHAAALTVVGLADIDPSVSALQIPMMFNSYEELDDVREKIAPQLEAALEAKGFHVLNWGDAGWVMFFAKEPFSLPADLKRMKLFVWAGDSSAVDLWKSAGFNPVPLASTDILPGLQTGLINAFDTTPLLALASQWFGLAPHMLNLEWAPLVGATVVSSRTWKQIPKESRPAIRSAAEEAGRRLRAEIRAANAMAVAAMQQNGLTVHQPSPEVEAAWLAAAEGVYPKIRGTLVPAEIFDEVRRLRDAHRSRPGP